MKIIKRKAELILSAEEKEIFIKTIKILNQILDETDNEDLIEICNKFYDEVVDARQVIESFLSA